MDIFPDRLESLRGGLTQKQMAIKIGVPLNTYTNWIRKVNVPKSDQLEKICTVFGVSADWLLGLAETAGNNSSDKRRIADLEHKLSAAIESMEQVLKALRG